MEITYMDVMKFELNIKCAANMARSMDNGPLGTDMLKAPLFIWQKTPDTQF